MKTVSKSRICLLSGAVLIGLALRNCEGDACVWLYVGIGCLVGIGIIYFLLKGIN